MNRLDKLSLQTPLRVSYVVPGYPTYAESLERAKFLLDLGVEILEIGVPFSDPTADGPTIRIATEKAIAQGTTFETCIGFCKAIRDYAPDTPLVLMTYLNPLYQYGYSALSESAAGVIDGLIVPDCPYEETAPLRESLQGVYLIPLVTLNTGNKRMEAMLTEAKGFVYLVTVKGTTGGKLPDLADITALLKRVRPHTRLPVIAGFGIKTPEQVSAITRTFDGYVVASEVISAFDEKRLSDLVALFQGLTVGGTV